MRLRVKELLSRLIRVVGDLPAAMRPVLTSPRPVVQLHRQGKWGEGYAVIASEFSDANGIDTVCCRVIRLEDPVDLRLLIDEEGLALYQAQELLVRVPASQRAAVEAELRRFARGGAGRRLGGLGAAVLTAVVVLGATAVVASWRAAPPVVPATAASADAWPTEAPAYQALPGAGQFDPNAFAAAAIEGARAAGDAMQAPAEPAAPVSTGRDAFGLDSGSGEAALTLPAAPAEADNAGCDPALAYRLGDQG